MTMNTPVLRLVVAYAQNRCIGHNNALPWHLPGDLAHFKQTTLGYPIVMGRKTWESIGRPLPGRQNLVITRNPNYQADGALLCHSLKEAIARCHEAPVICIIGGAEIYQQSLPLVDEIYATEVHTHVDGDSFFPVLGDEWQEQQRHPQAPENGLSFDFVLYQRNSG